MIPNHLWQSTVFAGVVTLLAFVLRKNHARTRYWLWLTASLKFLIPFSLLITVGKHIEWSAVTPKAQKVLVVMEQISQPFAREQRIATIAQPVLTHGSLLPAIPLMIWICGFAAVTILWWRRLQRIHTAIRMGAPLPFKIDVPALSTPALLEPGVFGIFHPVLLLPEGIADHLTAAQLKAIIAHEMCHVRRRDNLTAALHMAVEAIFWFHPLVWWLGARLVEERERACDEEVLRLGNEPQVYAESILRTCEFYLESPLACVSGITGSDLKQRIVRIMTRGLEKKLDFWRKLLLVVAAAAALTGPIVLGLMNAPKSRAQSQPAAGTSSPSFEVASVKLNRSGARNIMLNIRPGGRFIANNVPLKMLLEQAYQVKDSQLLGAPDWINSDHYDIEAKAEESTAAALEKLTPEQRKNQFMLMLQALLVDRFKLTVRHDTKDLPVYVLLVAKNGPKLKETAFTPADLASPKPLPPPGSPVSDRPGVWITGRGQIIVNGQGLDAFADVLSMRLGRIVLNKTGLNGKYDLKLQWTPDDSQDQMFKGAGDGPDGTPPTDAAQPPDGTGPTLFTAVQEQLGLKLEAQRSPVDVLVIDHIERPSEN
jgi:bla regulator protein BlaR1